MNIEKENYQNENYSKMYIKEKCIFKSVIEKIE
jgi:hypothetical protein